MLSLFSQRFWPGSGRSRLHGWLGWTTSKGNQTGWTWPTTVTTMFPKSFKFSPLNITNTRISHGITKPFELRFLVVSSPRAHCSIQTWMFEMEKRVWSLEILIGIFVDVCMKQLSSWEYRLSICYFSRQDCFVTRQDFLSAILRNMTGNRKEVKRYCENYYFKALKLSKLWKSVKER